MKILYIESRQKSPDLKLSKSEIKKLPKTIFLAYSIQYKSLASSVKKQLGSAGIRVKIFRQVLGCTKISSNLPLLLISSGDFHAANLLLQSPSVYILEGNRITLFPKSAIEKMKTRKQSALLNFLSADSVGILVSTKPGQQNLKKAVDLKKRLLKKGRQGFIFISDNIDSSQFENFDIDSWVNSACPGIAYDNPKIINLSDVPRF